MLSFWPGLEKRPWRVPAAQIWRRSLSRSIRGRAYIQFCEPEPVAGIGWLVYLPQSKTCGSSC